MSSAVNSVFMIINGNRMGDALDVPPFVSDQARFVTQAGWQVSVGVVDDRTSVRGLLRNIRRLNAEIAIARPTVVHAQYGSVTAAVARIVVKRLPLVVSFCGDDLLGTRFQASAGGPESFLRAASGYGGRAALPRSSSRATICAPLCREA